MAGTKLISLFVVVMVVAGPMSAQALTCGQVNSALAPCINYLKGTGAPTSSCCKGVSTLNNSAKTTADRQTACNCIKAAAKNIPGLSPSNAETLPAKCNVNIPYKIGLSTNCASIK